MKSKSSSQCGFFNLRVLILIVFFTGSIVVALFAMTVDGRTRRSDTNPFGHGFGSATARSAHVREQSGAPAGTAQWVWQNPLPQGNDLIDVKMLDSKTGIAVGWGGTILRTTDGGQNWRLVNIGNLLNTFDQYYTLHVTLPDQNNGWVTGYSTNIDGSEQKGLLFKTTDGGITWSDESINNAGFSDIQFIDSNNGIVIGGIAVGTSFYDMIRTTDGGNTWIPQLTGGSLNIPLAVYFSDLNNGTIVGDQGMIKRTTDGGITWIQQNSGTTNYLRDIFFTDLSSGTAVGADGTIIRTTDGGSNWASQSSPTPNNIFGVFFTDTDHGWAVTDSSDADRSSHILHTTNGGANWNIQYSVDPNVFSRLQEIYFTDVNTGIVVGNYGLTVTTSDGGNNWVEMSSNVTLNDLKSVSFPDANTGIAVGVSGTVAKTANGGNEWELMPSTNIRNNGVFFDDINTGWLAGGLSGAGFILKTTDGAQQWVQQYSSTAGINGIDFLDSSNGWAVGSNGEIVKTTDGGTNWNLQPSGTTRALRAIDFVDTNTGWVGGGDPGDIGEIFKTTDGGNTWVSQITTRMGSTISSISFVDSDNGWAVGGSISGGTGDGILLKTTDGGATWTNQSYNSDAALNGVKFIDVNHGMAVGDFLIISTTDGGNTWTRENVPQGRWYFSLSTLDPDNVTVVGQAGNILRKASAPSPTPTSTPRTSPTPRPRPTPMPRPTPPR
jgi:photosystem II stability/assembly factor-like uncharacterized protein